MWSNLKTEYKLVIMIGIVFLIVLIIYLVKIDAVDQVKVNLKKDEFSTCNSIDYQKGVKYTEYYCNFKDDKLNSLTINYPQFEDTSGDFEYLNRVLKNKYQESYDSVKYEGKSDDLQLYSYISNTYSIYTYNGILSIVIETQDIIGGYKNKTNSYTIYNVDLSTKKIISDDDFKKRFGIDRNYTTSLRAKVVKWYAVNFNYDYYNELSSYRNKNIDQSIESIAYNSLKNFYIDDDGIINFIMSLHTPTFGAYRPYLFTYKNGDTTFEILK